MKTHIISMLGLFLTVTLSAQLQLEHTYNFSGTIAELSGNEYKYFVMDVPLKQCRIFNEDHTLYKTINLSVPADYYLYDVKFVSRHTFNADDDIELLFIYSKSAIINNEEVIYYGMKVVSENGSTLMSLSNGGFAEIKKTSDGHKLLAYQYIYFEGYYLVYTNVYALGGTTKALEREANAMNLYPNPASGMLNVTLNPVKPSVARSLKIVDMQGKLISDHPVVPGSEVSRINLDALNPGTYILTLTDNKGIIQSVTFEKQ